MAEETILIIDDGRENREFIVKYILEPAGFNSLTARDGQEGLEMALEQRPDLILLDLQMPRLDGIGVLNNLAARNADIPVILMTFHGSEDIAIEVFRLGVRDYVKKPFSVDEMLEAIDRSLTETRLRKEKDALTERVIQANRELKRHIDELNVLYSIGKSVTSLIDLDQLLPRVVDAAIQVTEADVGYLYLYVNNGLICRAERVPNTGRARPVNQSVKDPLAMQVIKHAQPVVLSPEQLKANGNPLPNQPSTVAYAPLIVGEKVIGVLGVGNVRHDATVFTNHDSALLSALTDYAAIAIENSQNYEARVRAKEQETEQVRETFERFVPPSIVTKVLQTPESVQLGGKRQEISILFADIRGYTTWSEGADPEQVVETLNHYLNLGAQVILGWEGTLDKYFGDGLMAIFNAPEPQADHVHRAADAALALMRAAEEVSSQQGYTLSYSVGVTVGEAVVGYIGTERALNYTAIGDVVNLAKRLQEAASPSQILIDDSVVQRLGDRVHAKSLGQLKVKGRKQPAIAYELLDLKY